MSYEAGLSHLDRYQLLGLLATGGMGEVFLAKQQGPAGFSKVVVVKRILHSFSEDDSFIEMFINEARLAALLNHPNIVQIFELGQHESDYFIAMEYIHGGSVRAIRKKLREQKKNFPPAIAARIGSQALQGLHYAHCLKDEDGNALNIVHRDISPDNVLIGYNGVCKLVDFGIAKAAMGASTTRTGQVKGKFAYMAPEQFTGTALDGRADVYSVGVLLYEILCGVRPFVGSSEGTLIRRVLEDKPTAVRELNPDCPESIEAIVMKALSKERGDRYQSAEEMSSALEEAIGKLGFSAAPTLLSNFMLEVFGKEAAQQNPLVKTPTMSGPKSSTNPRTPTGVSQNRYPWKGTGSGVSNPQVPANAGKAQDFEDIEIEDGGRQGRAHAASRNRQLKTILAASIALVLVGGGLSIFLKSRTTPDLTVRPQTMVGSVSSAQGNQGAGPAQAAPRTTPAPGTELAQNPPAAAPVAVAVAEEPDKEKEKEEEEEERPAQRGVAPVRSNARSTRTVAHSRSTVAAKKTVTTQGTLSANAPSQEQSDGPGKVVFRVNPWAEVFIGSKSMGVTPMAALELPPGKVAFVLKNSELGVERRFEVVVKSGAEVLLRADLLD